MSNLFSENDGIRYSRDFSGIEFWNVSNVTNMSCMFYGVSFKKDIRTWNVSNVVDIRRMFSDSSNKSYKYLLRKNKSLLRKILPTLKNIFRDHE